MIPDLKILGITVYNWGYIVTMFFSFSFNLLWYRKKYKYKPLMALLITVSMVIFGFMIMLVLKMVHHDGIYYVRGVLFFPLAAYIVCLILKTNFAQMLDFATPQSCINHAIPHYFCLFAGCCYGYPTTGHFAVWNEKQGAMLFPIQAVESTAVVLILLFIILYARKKQYNTHGIVYFIYMLLFASTRFGFEFLRNNTDSFWQLSIHQYYCIAEVIVAVIFLILIKRYLSHPELKEKHPLLYREDIDEWTRLKLAFKKAE